MKTLLFLLTFFLFTDGLNIIGPRLQSGSKDRFIYLKDGATLSARRKAIHNGESLVSTGGVYPKRALLKFSYDNDQKNNELSDDWRKEHTVDEAYLELNIGEVNCEARYEIVKVVTDAPDGTISQSTWDCAHDGDISPADFESDCYSKWSGGAYISYGIDHIYIGESNANVSIDITQLAETNPDTLMLKRVYEEAENSNRCKKDKTECPQCSVEILDAKIRIHTYQLDVLTEETLYDGFERVIYENDGVKISGQYGSSLRPTNGDLDQVTVVRLRGMPFSEYSVYDAGVFRTVGNELIISQQCQGPSECKLENGVDTIDRRGEFHYDLLFISPDGPQLNPKTTIIEAQDQGSSMALGLINYAKSQGEQLMAYVEHEGWSFGFWCPLDDALDGTCYHGFAPPPAPGANQTNFGGDFFRECSQDAKYGDVNTTTSCGASMHIEYNYLYRNSTQQPFCSFIGGPGAPEEHIRAAFPDISALDFGCLPLSGFNSFLVQRIEPASAAESDFQVSFWQEGEPEFFEKRASTIWRVRNLYVVEDQNGTMCADPTCDPQLIVVRERTDSTTPEIPIDQANATHKAHTGAATVFTDQVIDGTEKPGVNVTYLITSGWAGFGSAVTNPILVDNCYTGPAFCPGLQGPECGARCPTDGHGVITRRSDEYYSKRKQDLPSSSFVDATINPVGAHNDAVSGSGNGKAWAACLENIVGGYEEHQIKSRSL